MDVLEGQPRVQLDQVSSGSACRLREVAAVVGVLGTQGGAAMVTSRLMMFPKPTPVADYFESPLFISLRWIYG